MKPLAYRFEDELPVYKHHVMDIPMGALQNLARRVWEGEGIRKPMPKVTAGRGLVVAGKRLTSYYDVPTHQIVLARHHRCHFILMHELCHALGYHGHGWQFVRHMQYLLVRYCGYKRRWVNDSLAVALDKKVWVE